MVALAGSMTTYFSARAAALAFARWTDAFTDVTSERFLPHGYCYLWNRQLLALHIGSDATIFASYLAISLSLAWLVYRERARLPFQWIFVAFGLFIVSCGFTHALEIVVLWHPFYWFAGDVKLVTALASAITAVALPFLLPGVGKVLTAASQSRSNELRFLAASDSSHDAFMILETLRDDDGEVADFRFCFLNSHAGSLLSGVPEHFEGKLLCDMFPGSREEGLFDLYKQVVASGERIEREFPVKCSAIRASWLRFQVTRLGDGVAVTTTDLSAIKESEQRLAKLASFKKNIIASSPLATIVVDLSGTILAFNLAAERLLWYRSADVVDRETPLVFLHPEELEQRAKILTDELHTPVASGIEVLTAKARLGHVDQSEWTFYRRGGTHFQAEVSTSALTDANNELTGVILIAHDITERKHAEEYIAHVAHHDALTGLPTRGLLHDRLSMCLAHARRDRSKVALLVLDVDHFKRINDGLGHHAGDQLLKVVALRLQATVRASDTVARMGGDEFVVVLDDLSTVEEAERIAQKLVSTVGVPVSLGSQVVRPTISMGICLYPDNASDVESMLRNADEAMYRAKALGRNRFRTFTDAMEAEATRKRQIEAGLHHAVALEEFELLYQPQVSLKSGLVTGVEALLRWRSPSLGTVMPGEFIPVAEEIGLIQPIGEWVLQEACMTGARLQAESGRELTIAVNVSPRQFYHASLPAALSKCLVRSGLAPQCLELEITENVLLSDSPEALTVLEQVRKLGISLAIDDFGTGCSSMSYIMQFRVDRIKIDRSFICDMTYHAGSSAIAGAILALASALSIRVVAEGVESAEQLDLLRSKGCDEAQGYYYARAVGQESVGTVISAIEQDLYQGSSAAS